MMITEKEHHQNLSFLMPLSNRSRDANHNFVKNSISKENFKFTQNNRLDISKNV